MMSDRMREEGVFDFVGRRDPVARADDHRRGVEFVEGELRDLGGHRLQGAAAFAGVGGQQDLAGLLHRLDHLLVVERHDRAGVDDLAGDAVLLFEFLGGVEGAVERRADREDRQVLAGLLDVRLAEGDFVGARRARRLGWNSSGWS